MRIFFALLIELRKRGNARLYTTRRSRLFGSVCTCNKANVLSTIMRLSSKRRRVYVRTGIALRAKNDRTLTKRTSTMRVRVMENMVRNLSVQDKRRRMLSIHVGAIGRHSNILLRGENTRNSNIRFRRRVNTCTVGVRHLIKNGTLRL